MPIDKTKTLKDYQLPTKQISKYNNLYCPKCGKQTCYVNRWEECDNCGQVFKLLSSFKEQQRGW